MQIAVTERLTQSAKGNGPGIAKVCIRPCHVNFLKQGPGEMDGVTWTLEGDYLKCGTYVWKIDWTLHTDDHGSYYIARWPD